jgi:hypothetical protein
MNGDRDSEDEVQVHTIVPPSPLVPQACTGSSVHRGKR